MKFCSHQCQVSRIATDNLVTRLTKKLEGARAEVSSLIKEIRGVTPLDFLHRALTGQPGLGDLLDLLKAKRHDIHQTSRALTHAVEKKKRYGLTFATDGGVLIGICNNCKGVRRHDPEAPTWQL